MLQTAIDRSKESKVIAPHYSIEISRISSPFLQPKHVLGHLTSFENIHADARCFLFENPHSRITKFTRVSHPSVSRASSPTPRLLLLLCSGRAPSQQPTS